MRKNQPTRILQTKSFFFSFSATLRVTLPLLPSTLVFPQVFERRLIIYISRGQKDLLLEIRAHRLLVYNICKCLLFLSVKASPGCIIGHLMEDAAIRGRIFAPFPSSIPPPATSHKSKKRLCDQISI